MYRLRYDLNLKKRSNRKRRAAPLQVDNQPMSLEGFFDRRIVADKPVYVVDDHHKALAPWALIRRQFAAAPYLLTIDHHTDTDDAFASYVSLTTFGDPSLDGPALAAEMLAAIDWRRDDSVANAIAKLKHDEHIHAATMSGVLAASFSIQFSDSGGYGEPNEARLYVVPFKCAMDCAKRVYDDECVVHHAVEIIETRYLDDQLARLREMTNRLGLPDIEALPYILDIDLDVFHSMKAATPDDASTFRRLIRGAVGMTIATEAEWVKEVWEDDDHEPSAERLLEIVLDHINAAWA